MEIYFEIASKIYAFILQLLTAFFFYRFCRIFIRKKSIWLVALFYLLTVIILEIYPGDLLNFWIYLFASIIAFLMLLPIKDVPIHMKGFITVTFFAIRWLAPSVITVVYNPISAGLLWLVEKWLIPQTTQVVLVYFIYTICIMVVMILLYGVGLWFVVFLYQKYMNRDQRMFSPKETMILLVPALSGMSSYAMMNQYHRLLEINPLFTNKQFQGYWAVHNVIILIAMLLVLILLQQLEIKRKKEQSASILATQMKNLQQYIASVDLAYQEMKLLKHDIRNHVTIVEGLLEKRNYTEAEQYVLSIHQVLKPVELEGQTGNPITDVLLQEKMKQVKKYNIRIKSTMRYPQFVEVDAFDMSIVLHNVLENAIEATKKLENSCIELSSTQYKNSYLLTIRNSFSGPLKWQDGHLVTTKSDPHLHGLGLQNIKVIATKYHGEIEIEIEDSIFQLTVLFMFSQST